MTGIVSLRDAGALSGVEAIVIAAIVIAAISSSHHNFGETVFVLQNHAKP